MKNKGEWSEALAFVKLIYQRKLFLADQYLNPSNDYLVIDSVTNKNIAYQCHLSDDNLLTIRPKQTKDYRTLAISDVLSQKIIDSITKQIKEGKRTFDIHEFDEIAKQLGFELEKGGSSSQKSDILLGISYPYYVKQQAGFSVKSFLGSKPTLLNASGNTSFVYRVEGLKKDIRDTVNTITGRYKIKKRLNRISLDGGKLLFDHIERSAMTYNLALIDPDMPLILGYMLKQYHANRHSSIKSNVLAIHKANALNTDIQYGDLDSLNLKVKHFLVNAMLCFFPGKKWNGTCEADGCIVIKENGDLVAFHISRMQELQDYLFNTIRFDTPSVTRHRYGSLYSEQDGQYYFKLNLQLRF